jgi:transposase
MSALVCGLDVHKDSTYAAILNLEEKIVNQSRMENERVLPFLSHFKVAKVGMESSNQIAPLFRQLTSKGYDVVVSHPKKTRYIAEAKIKSDRVDPEAIAELVRLRALAYFPTGEIAKLREKVRRRAFLVRERVKLRVKVKSALTHEGLKWPIDHGLFTKKGVEWLHGLNIDSVESYLRILESLDEEIKLLSKELVGVAEDDEEIKLLMTIPGIGRLSSELGACGYKISRLRILIPNSAEKPEAYTRFRLYLYPTLILLNCKRILVLDYTLTLL